MKAALPLDCGGELPAQVLARTSRKALSIVACVTIDIDQLNIKCNPSH